MSASFNIVAPCSTSNLGAGFDAIGIALGGPRLLIRCTPGNSPLRISALSGEGANALPRGGENRVLVAARAAADRIGVRFESLCGELAIDNTIPLVRGLGSSAAAAVAGAIVAEALHAQSSGKLEFDDARVLATALALEGHPDNVIACLRGGAQVAVLDAQGVVRACPVKPPAPLRAALFIPDQELQTSAARAVIPKTVPLADAVFNLGRAALFVAALSQGRFELVGEAMSDRLHQPPRTQLMPWLPAMISVAREAGAMGAALSGAGTTVFALTAAGAAERVVEALRAESKKLGLAGRAQSVEACAAGARIES